MFNSTQNSNTPSTSINKPSSNKSGSKATGRWTKEEHQRFVEGLKKFGKNWKLVEEHVGTRNGAQIRSHAQKFFNRLEREFNLKFEDLNLQSDKLKFEETLKLISGHSPTTTSTAQETPVKESKVPEKIQKGLSPIPEVPCKFDTLVQNSMRSNTLSVSNSPKLNHFEYPPALVKRASRKMSEDILQTKSYSLFDVVMSKLKLSNNMVSSPKLSDLVEISSSTRSSFDATNMKPQSFKPVMKAEPVLNLSFRPNPRKMSEDNVLAYMRFNQASKPPVENLSEYETITKKVKQY